MLPDHFVKCLCCAVCVVQACFQVFPQRDALLVEKSSCNITCVKLCSTCVLGKFEQMWVTGKLIGKQLSAQRAHTWGWWFTASLCRLLSGCRPDHVCVFLKRCSCLHFDLVQIIGCKSAWLQFSLVSFHFLRRQKLASPDVVMVCPHSHRDPTT